MSKMEDIKKVNVRNVDGGGESQRKTGLLCSCCTYSADTAYACL